MPLAVAPPWALAPYHDATPDDAPDSTSLSLARCIHILRLSSLSETFLPLRAFLCFERWEEAVWLLAFAAFTVFFEADDFEETDLGATVLSFLFFPLCPGGASAQTGEASARHNNRGVKENNILK
jgi:hypothetical protein